MPKSVIIAAGAFVVVVAVGGVFVLMNKKDTPTESNKTSNSQNQSQTPIDDPNGDYKLFSDASITKHPEDGVTFGNGQVLSFEYDGSKTKNDQYATLSYQLYYIAENGSVHPMGGGNMEGEGGKGTFKTAEGDKVFDSSAKDRTGFFELQATYGTSADETGKISGKNVKLGMYSIKFDISE